MKLSDGERHSMVTMGNRFILNVSPVIESDFGNYSCVSENTLGRVRGAETNIILTGNVVNFFGLLSRPNSAMTFELEKSIHIQMSETIFANFPRRLTNREKFLNFLSEF